MTSHEKQTVNQDVNRDAGILRFVEDILSDIH